MLVEPGSTWVKAASLHCCQPSDITFFLCYNDQATDVYIYIWKHPQPDVFRVNGALFDESVKRLVWFIPFPQHANSSLTPLGRSRLCMIVTVNCEFCQTLGRRCCLPFFERRLLRVCLLARSPLAGCFCVCVFEQRLHTSGCLLIAKESLSQCCTFAPI